MTYADIRPEVDRRDDDACYRRLSPRVLHLHSTFGPRPRHPQMWQERFERCLIALIFGVVIATAGVGLLFFIPALIAVIRRLVGG